MRISRSHTSRPHTGILRPLAIAALAIVTVAALFGCSSDSSKATPAEHSTDISSQLTYERSMEKAKEYLAASNYDGREFNVICLAGSANEMSAQVIQGTLYELGINMKITAAGA